MSELIVKDNALMNASYNLNLVEQRLILLAIIEARESGKGINANDPLVVHAESYITQFGVARQTAYQALKDACKDLFARQFSYQESRRKGTITITSRWVSQVGYMDNEATVELVFAPAVVPLITRLEEQFTKYDIEQISGLSSAYAVRLYELLICWRSAGKTPIIEITEFRKRLGVLDSEYQRMERLKTGVLVLAMEQINQHTDINVTYKQHKAGRTVTGFSFTFTQKKQLKDVTPKPKKAEPKPKAAKQEEQLDWMTSDILDRFNGLSSSQQQAILNKAESTLKGTKQARFKAARSGSVKQLMAEF
ncbi:MAG TPA: replication initiation protein RepM, partial [Agitococcus sp.]|nr:replication initiation protein RepM [Agitococcus sp.]